MKIQNIENLTYINSGIHCGVYQHSTLPQVFKAFYMTNLKKIKTIKKVSQKAAKEGLAPKVLSPIVKWRDNSIDAEGYGFWTEYVNCKETEELKLCYEHRFEEQLLDELENLLGNYWDSHRGNFGLLDGALVCIDFGGFVSRK